MERSFALKRGVIDLESGEFPVTLFTNGEASDGHIIDIRGMQVGRLPMFVNHDADPVSRMGGLHDPHKAGKSTRLGGASLKMRAQIDMAGDGTMADIRRDVAHGISVGDITAMSGRWDVVGEPKARASLPKAHYAHSKVSGGFHTPLFFPESVALEGSIVGVGADKAALVGRSRSLDKPQHVREFYDVLVNGDALTREQRLTMLFEEAGEVGELEEIETAEGWFFVPRDVALVWGRSTDEPAADELEGEDSYQTVPPFHKPERSEPEASETAPEEVREEANAELPAMSMPTGGDDGMKDEMQRILDDSAARADQKIKDAREKLLYEHYGVIPNV